MIFFPTYKKVNNILWEKTKRFQKNDSERYQNPSEKEKNKKHKQYKNLSEEKKTPLWLQTI